MITIQKKHMDEIIKHAKNINKQEICGILAGKNGMAEKVFRMENASDSPQSCYFMDPAEQLKVIKEIRKSGFEMVGIYHSHPSSGAYPSKRDVELAFYPDVSYLIVSLESDDRPIIRSFRITDSKILEEEINVV